MEDPKDNRKYRRNDKKRPNLSTRRRKPGPKKQKKVDEVIQQTSTVSPSEVQQEPCPPLCRSLYSNLSLVYVPVDTMPPTIDEVRAISELSVEQVALAENMRNKLSSILRRVDTLPSTNDDDDISPVQTPKSPMPAPPDPLPAPSSPRSMRTWTPAPTSTHLVECDRPNHDVYEYEPGSRRIVDFGHLWRQLLQISQHSPQDCGIRYMIVTEEQRSGLKSTFSVKCTLCHATFQLTTDSQPVDVTTASVAATYELGMGQSALNTFLAVLNIPTFSSRTFAARSSQLNEAFVQLAEKSMREAAEVEAGLAVLEGRVSPDNVPWIYVTADGAWCKRSYGTNYASSGGVGIIIGCSSKRIVHMGVKNKTCYICACARNTGLEPAEHSCSINHIGSSSSMEPAAIVQGFRSSVATRGVRYLFLVADGDSSVFHNILVEDPYGDVNLVVKKIECKNHVLRRLCTNMRKLVTNLSGRRVKDPVRDGEFVNPKGLVSKKIFSLRMGIDRACSHRGQCKKDLKAAAGLLYNDIVNAPYHVFGDHRKCVAYFCDGTLKDGEFNTVPTLVALRIFPQIEEIVQRVARNSPSLIHNLNNNVVESSNTTLMHSTGKKVLNYTSRHGYRGRSSRAVIHFNDTDAYGVLHEHLSGTGPNRIYAQYKRTQVRKRLRNRATPKRRKERFSQKKDPKTGSGSGAGKSYGPNAEQPDMDVSMYRRAAALVLQSYKISREDAISLEERTRGQADSSEWFSERRKRLTGSNFKKYCSLKDSTSTARLVGEVVCSSFTGNADTEYGKTKEPFARALLEKKLNGLHITDCGFFIHPTYPYLGASPDGKVDGCDVFVEIKCPASLPRDKSLRECMADKHKALRFWKGGVPSMHWNHMYYFQVQGQLEITDAEKCIFAVYKETERDAGIVVEEIEYEVIERDRDFWKTKMMPKLQKFFFNCLLPELTDSRRKRSMPYREMNIHGEQPRPIQSKEGEQKKNVIKRTNRREKKNVTKEKDAVQECASNKDDEELG